MTPGTKPGADFWTKDRKKRAALLWNKGLTTGLIAAELSCTRNAVVGWVWRNRMEYKLECGISEERRAIYHENRQREKHERLQKMTVLAPGGGKDPRYPGKKTDATWVRNPRQRVLPPTQRAPRNAKPDSLYGDLSCGDYRARHAKYWHEVNTGCKWPIGRVATPEFHFCGSARRGDKPYCDAHCQRAYSAEVANAAKEAINV